ncbi:MAG: hypothetical protein ACTSQG_00030 [Promethearchaeota archaeon]
MNEITIFENENGQLLYFTKKGMQQQKIRKNSKIITYWNGNNWRKESLEFVGRKKRAKTEDVTNYNHPVYCYHYVWTFKDGSKLQIEDSNTSGSLTPYYTEEKEYY